MGASGQVFHAVLSEPHKPKREVALKQMNVVMKDMAVDDPFMVSFLSEM